MTSRRLASWILLALTAPLLFVEPRASIAALWPSALAISLAFVTRDIHASLFLGAFAGACLLRGGNLAGAFLDLFSEYLVPALTDPWNVSVVVFTLLMGGFVELLERSGGLAALARRLEGHRSDPHRTGLTIYLLGWLFFVDGLGNAMLLGKTLRPSADRAGLSREKLAFIVDSTSSPIASLALVSTWVAYEISVIRDGFANATPGVDAGVAPYGMLIESLPYRFYPWFLLLVVLLSVRGRDLGPMIAAERASRAAASPSSATPVDEPDRSLAIASLSVLPILVLVAGVVVGLWLDGGGGGRRLTLAAAIDALGRADAARVFVWATAAAIAVAMVLDSRLRREAPGPTAIVVDGMQKMFRPALILVLAWTLNGVIQEMGAADYLVHRLGDRLPASFVPAGVFVLAAAVSFSTGTSWGTMAIVMPLAIPLAASLTGFVPGAAPSPLVVATIGAVLAGAVFGDHASPISDTTIVSAFASDCDVMAHVRTQLPYVLLAAAIAIGFGYVPAGFGISPWVLLPLGFTACWVGMRLGQRT